MSISAIPSSLAALSLTLSQLQDSVSVISAASQSNSAVTSQASIAAVLGTSPSSQPPSTPPLAVYGSNGDLSTGQLVGNALNLSV